MTLFVLGLLAGLFVAHVAFALPFLGALEVVVARGGLEAHPATPRVFRFLALVPFFVMIPAGLLRMWWRGTLDDDLGLVAAQLVPLLDRSASAAPPHPWTEGDGDG